MPRPQIESFTKFLLSSGVFLCIAAFAGPALVLRETTVLQLPRAELARLTPVARHELERRQRVARDVGEATPYATVVLFVAGLTLVIAALPRMRSKERTEDAMAAASLKKLDAETAPQSRQERRQSLVADLGADVAAGAVTEGHESRDRGAAPMLRHSRDGAVSPPVPGPVETLERIQRAEQVERRVHRRLAQLTLPKYELRTNVRVGSHDDRLLLDGLLTSGSRRGLDVLIEIKHAPRPKTMVVRQGLEQLSSYLLQYMTRVERRAKGWLIVVCDDAVSDETLERVREAVPRQQPGDALAVSVIREHDLDELSLPDFEF